MKRVFEIRLVGHTMLPRECTLYVGIDNRLLESEEIGVAEMSREIRENVGPNIEVVRTQMSYEGPPVLIIDYEWTIERRRPAAMGALMHVIKQRAEQVKVLLETHLATCRNFETTVRYHSTSLPDYFGGCAGYCLAVPVNQKSTYGEIKNGLICELEAMDSYNFGPHLQPLKDIEMEKLYDDARAEIEEMFEAKYLDKPWSENEVSDECYAYFSISVSEI